MQAFNKLGAGPMSDEVKQYTCEGVPEQPPHDTTCTTLTSQTIRISWVSPPLNTANGVIKGYKVIYGPSDSWFSKYTGFAYYYSFFFSFIYKSMYCILYHVTQTKVQKIRKLPYRAKLFYTVSRSSRITVWKY